MVKPLPIPCRCRAFHYRFRCLQILLVVVHGYFLNTFSSLSKIAGDSDMKANVRWLKGMRFGGVSGSGHTVTMDTSQKHGGDDSAPSPMEMILLGVGGCSSVDVVSILQKARQDIVDCHVELEAERVDAVPAIFRKIHLHFVVSGHNLKENHVKRAVEMSAEKYCSASIMLAKAGVEITHSYEIVQL